MHHARTRPKSAAFVFREEVWTYERLAAEAELLARGLAARGVGPGDRVALHMMSRPEMVVAYYACFQLGGYRGTIANCVQIRRTCVHSAPTETRSLYRRDGPLRQCRPG